MMTVHFLNQFRLSNIKHSETTTGMFTFFVLLCVCSVSFVSFSYWSLSPLTPAGVPVVWGCPLRCMRTLNFVHYVRCVKIFKQDECMGCVRYCRNRRTLYIAVVEFCVYLIHLSLWYCKSRQRSFVRFWYFVLPDHRKLLCVLLHCCSRCVVVLRRASKLWTVTTLGHTSVEWVMAR